jgi:hypothetical protein
MADKHSFGDAQEVLLRAALIDKSAEDGVVSIHRLVQAAVIRRSSKSDRSRHFDAAIHILSHGFPDTWTKDTGHEFAAWTKDAWTRYEKCLPHIVHLVKQAKKYGIQTRNIQRYGELLLPCSWYVRDLVFETDFTNQEQVSIRKGIL